MDSRLERAALLGPAVLTLHELRDGYPLLAASPNVERTLGYSADVLAGSPQLWASRVHPEDEGRLMRGLEDIVCVGAGELTFRFRRNDDTYRWLKAAARVVPEDDRGPRELVLSLHDVTDRTEYEQALRQQTDALRRSNVELEQFAHIASHDLSEPLRMVASYTRLIADRYSDQLDDDARDFIGFAMSGAERMQAMIGDLLTYSRLGQADPDQKPLDLSSVVDTVEAVLRQAISESGVQIRRDGALPIVLAAEAQCLTVLQNLIANAIKFRQEDRPAVIAVSARPEGAFWRVAVSDNGIGIDAASHERVFEAFKKLHRPEQYPGTGLGLSLCRRIVSHHGGTIGLESEPGVGTTVWFTLPAPPAESTAAFSRGARPAAGVSV